MRRRLARAVHTSLLGFLSMSGLAASTSPASAQHTRELADATLRRTLTGRVCMPDGSPAVGAVVVTSAGGEACTGADGSFVVEVELPLDAECLDVSATLADVRGSGAWVGSFRVVPAALVTGTSIGRLALSPSAECPPRWLPTFGQVPGTGGSVNAATVFDDGSGPELFVGGSFELAGGVEANGVARWDGSRWTALGDDLGPPTAFAALAMTVHDDGGGPALYVGGVFTSAGASAANRIARWDGTSWSALGSGMDGNVLSLAVHDDGGEPALYAGGQFTTAGGVSASRIAKWDGMNWSPLGTGMNGTVYALVEHDDGNGPALYAGGEFTTAGGVAANRIAKWDGTSWSALGLGVADSSWPPSVRALVEHDDGSGPALYAGGSFTQAGVVLANRVAKWDGTSWSALGGGIPSQPGNYVEALVEHDDGSGPALYVGGRFSGRCRKWDGSSWATVGGGIECCSVRALAVHDDGRGPALYAGGVFTSAGGMVALSIAQWDGSSWSSLGKGLAGYFVLALTVFDDGSGPALFAGGAFDAAGSETLNGVGKWNGSSWSSLLQGVSGTYDEVSALAVYDDGGGPSLYAGGNFTTAGGVTVNGIARWDGSSWSPLGSGVGREGPGLDTRVLALVEYNDGNGPALYAGGFFTTAGGVTANRIARWDGTSWSALGSGLNGAVAALAVYDDGGGPALYAGGGFTTAGGVARNRIARWNGTSWSALGSGMDAWVTSLTVYDDGGGPALYAAGFFTTAGGFTVNRVAKWNGSNWSGLSTGMNDDVHALVTHDDGSGPALYAAGGLGTGGVAKWDGSSWAGLGAGMNGIVYALAAHDDGSGAALFAGGGFTVSTAGDSYLAKWGYKSKDTTRRRKL